MNKYVAASLCAVSLSLLHGCNADTDEAITFEINETNNEYPIPYITVSINGHSANLALDTGSLGFAVTNNFSERAGLSPSGETHRVRYPNGDVEELRVTERFDVFSGNYLFWPRVNSVVQITPMSDTLGLDGNFDPIWFSELGCIEVDFAKRQLSAITSTEECPFFDSRFTLKVPANDLIALEEESTYALIDTGSSISQIDETYTDLEFEYLNKSGRINSIWGKANARLTGPITIKFGDWELPIETSAVHGGGLGKNAEIVVGYNALRNGRLVIVDKTYYWYFD